MNSVMAQGGAMKNHIRMCSVHKVVEVLPGIWKLNHFLTQKPENAPYDLKEVPCPICMQVATMAFAAQFPALYAASAQENYLRLA
jgi:hypothetical protein